MRFISLRYNNWQIKLRAIRFCHHFHLNLFLQMMIVLLFKLYWKFSPVFPILSSHSFTLCVDIINVWPLIHKCTIYDSWSMIYDFKALLFYLWNGREFQINMLGYSCHNRLVWFFKWWEIIVSFTLLSFDLHEKFSSWNYI